MPRSVGLVTSSGTMVRSCSTSQCINTQVFLGHVVTRLFSQLRFSPTYSGFVPGFGHQ